MKFVARIARKLFQPKPPVDLRGRREFIKQATGATAAAVLLPGGLGALLAACAARTAGNDKNTTGNFVELHYSDVIAILKDAYPRFREKDILKLKTEKNRPQLARSIAKHIITNLYKGEAVRSGNNKLIADELKGMAPHQIAEVIKRLGKSGEMQTTARNFKDNLSADQWTALEARFDPESTNMTIKFGGKIVLVSLTNKLVLDTIKAVKVDPKFKSAAAGGVSEPEVVICDIDEARSPFIPYEIQRGKEKTLYLRGEVFHASTDAKIRLDFGKGVTVVSSKVTAYGFEATIKVSKDRNKAPLGDRTLTIYINDQEIKKVNPALIIKPAPKKVAASTSIRKKVIRKKKPAAAKPARPRRRPVGTVIQ